MNEQQAQMLSDAGAAAGLAGAGGVAKALLDRDKKPLKERIVDTVLCIFAGVCVNFATKDVVASEGFRSALVAMSGLYGPGLCKGATDVLRILTDKAVDWARNTKF